MDRIYYGKERKLEKEASLKTKSWESVYQTLVTLGLGMCEVNLSEKTNPTSPFRGHRTLRLIEPV